MTSATARFVEAAKSHFQMRPALPLGRPISLGDVIQVTEGGQIVSIGTLEDVLGVEVGEILPPARGTSSQRITSGDDVRFGVLAKGAASELFPQVPSANARVEIELSRGDSVFALVTKPRIERLANPHRLHDPMRKAFFTDAWKPGYAVVVELGTPQHVHVILAKNADTKVMLEAGADVTLVGMDIADAAASLHTQHTSKDVTEYRASGTPIFYNAIKVRQKPLSGVTEVVPL